MYSRRGFLKLLGAAVAAMALPACKKDEEDTVNPSMEKAHNFGSNANIDDLPDGEWLIAKDMEEVTF